MSRMSGCCASLNISDHFATCLLEAMIDDGETQDVCHLEREMALRYLDKAQENTSWD